MQLWFVIGTAGELIKIYPLMISAEKKGIGWTVVHTGQSGVNFWNQWEDFQLDRSKAIGLTETGVDLTSSGLALSWFIRAAISGKESLKKRIHETNRQLNVDRDFFVVHGDTISTLLGAWLAYRLKVRLVHVEAGLRSSRLLQPFPEEINRRLTSRFVDRHMAPDERAYANLHRSGFRNGLTNTHGNTLLDSIKLVLSGTSTHEIPSSSFVVINIHRHENLSSSRRWRQIVDIVSLVAQNYTVIFATHPPTRKKLENDTKSFDRLRKAGVHFRERLPFSHFIRLLQKCEFVITDGGSNQEECFYLGKPCLIMREATERVEGLETNCLLSHFEENTIHHFIENYQKYQRPPYEASKSPTEVILQSLLSSS